jgi:hypothetical protein
MGCRSVTRVAPLRACGSLSELALSDAGNIRDLDTLSELPNLRELEWTETAAPHAVLAASAVLRGDAAFVEASADAWLASMALSKTPDVFGLRLVRAFALGETAPWAADALTRLASAMRDRARHDEDPQIITPATWASWARVVRDLNDGALRAAVDASLTDLHPNREVLPVLTPVLTALADLGPESARRSALPWLVARIRELLSPIAAQDEPARQAAPAAAVFYAGFGLDAEVRAWLERGTRPEAPHWRDRVVNALLARDVRRDELASARRRLKELVTEDAQDAARAMLAEAFAARLPAEAASELDAIGNDALRARVARTLGAEPAMLAEPAGLYAVVLALQDDGAALGQTLATLVETCPESPLVAVLAREFAPPGPDPVAASDLLPEVLAHPAWREEIAGRKWDGFTGRLPAPRALLAEAVAARAVAEGLIEPETRDEIVGRVG